MKPGPTVGGPQRAHLRLLPPPLLPPPEELAPPLALAVGDVVVYASHGIGRVEARRPAGRGLPETVALVFESGLRVILPFARALDALRPLSGEPELEDVRRTLRAEATPPVEPWSKRNRATRDKLAAGQATALAEVVRDGLQREQRLAAGGIGRTTAPSDRQLYVRARALLTAEIALCRGIELAEADAWILDQVAEPPPT
jgi:RNA polymerase-interacting CarD/CdnL/TRCF family regulator